MKIIIDIIHPANIHYFKNFAQKRLSLGDEVLFTAREREVVFELLTHYGFNYKKMGRSWNGKIGKMLYLIKAEFLMLYYSLLFKPDIYISFCSSFTSHISWLFGKQHITFDDTEHAKLNRIIYLPFVKNVFTPKSFNINLGKKQVRFNSFMELFYLHPEVFTPSESIYSILGILPEDKYVIIRLVSWEAFHDIGESGISGEDKIKIVKMLEVRYHVFISSEGRLPKELEKYKISIPAHRMHDALAFAEFFVGEGGTMASEAALLGTYALYINTLKLGYLNELESKYGIVKNINTSGELFREIEAIMKMDDLKSKSKQKQKIILESTINPNQFLDGLIEHKDKK